MNLISPQQNDILCFLCRCLTQKVTGNSSTQPSCLPVHYWTTLKGGLAPSHDVRKGGADPSALCTRVPLSNLQPAAGTSSHVVFIRLWCFQGCISGLYACVCVCVCPRPSFSTVLSAARSSHPSAVGAVRDKPAATATPPTRWHAAQPPWLLAAHSLDGTSYWPGRY